MSPSLSITESIEKLHLPRRVLNALRNGNLLTIGALLEALKDDWNLLILKEFGRKSLQDVKDELIRNGFNAFNHKPPVKVDHPFRKYLKQFLKLKYVRDDIFSGIITFKSMVRVLEQEWPYKTRLRF